MNKKKKREKNQVVFNNYNKVSRFPEYLNICMFDFKETN